MLLALAAISPAHADDIPARGVVKAVQQAALSTDQPMRILHLPFRESQRFKVGDVLVEFDCRRQAGELEAARGVVREAEMTVASNQSLEKHKSIGRFEVEIAQARLMKARGELKALQARIDDCVVRAPFNGRISEAPVREREFTTAQRPYIAIIEDDSFEIELIVSSTTLTQLAIGQPFAFRLDDMPTAEVKAEVLLVGATVDPVSKTGKFVASVRGGPPELAVGMSGTAIFGTPAR